MIFNTFGRTINYIMRCSREQIITHYGILIDTYIELPLQIINIINCSEEVENTIDTKTIMTYRVPY